MRATRPPRGFTLLETLVALGLGALVLATLLGTVTSAARARERSTARAERTAAGRSVLLHLAAELEAALPSTAPTSPTRFVALAAPSGAPPWSELRFATAARGAGILVGYRVEPETPRGPGRLVRVGTGEESAEAALGEVHLFRVRCFDGSAWRADWTAPGLPRAVELTVGFGDGAGGVTELATTVALALGGP